MIRIVNLRTYIPLDGEILIKVDRSNKILGNRFYMHNESERDKVCDRYKEWFDECLRHNDTNIINELNRIHKITKYADVALGCWCAPKRCHAETIKEFLRFL